MVEKKQKTTRDPIKRAYNTLPERTGGFIKGIPIGGSIVFTAFSPLTGTGALIKESAVCPGSLGQVQVLLKTWVPDCLQRQEIGRKPGMYTTIDSPVRKGRVPRIHP
jgi:hypothetical protein